MIGELTQRVAAGCDLSAAEMETAMESIMTGKAGTPEIVSFLNALADKGETVDELYAAAVVMRRHSLKIKVVSAAKSPVLDTCGTGGDRKGTFNVSTAAAFVAAGCGILVAKHGNRSVTSACGSADILEELGIEVNIAPEKAEEIINSIGVVFLYAPGFHPAMKYAMPARRQINRRTIFNMLGPLTNPAAATHQLIGVFQSSLADSVVSVLKRLGSVHVLAVHGEDGMDEITLTDNTFVCEVNRGKQSSYSISPEQFGMRRRDISELKGGTVQDNAAILVSVLEGKRSPYRDMVILNAAAAIYAADRSASINEGAILAAESIDSGRAMTKLNLLREQSPKKRL